MRDDVRSACFAAPDVLQAKWGADVRYAALDEGSTSAADASRSSTAPTPSTALRACSAGPAALAVNSSPKQIRYRNEQTADCVLYGYQSDDPDDQLQRLAAAPARIILRACESA